MADAKNDLTSQVLRRALKNEFNLSNDEDIVFTDVNEASGSGVSDNFGGELKLISFTLTVRGQMEEQPHSYIVKSLPENPVVKDMLESFELFPTEINFYNHVIKDLQNLREEFSLPPMPFCKCFYASMEDRVIVLENLKTTGFTPPSKVYQFKGLPNYYIRKVFTELARFHAVSYHYIQTNPDRVKESYECIDPSNGGFFGTLRKNKYFEARHLDNLTVASKTLCHNFTSKRLGQKLQKFQKKVAKEGSKEEPKGMFHVILHGDAWANNFMIRNDDAETTKGAFVSVEREDSEDLVIIDFQMSRIGSPASDLLYCLASSTSLDSRKAHLKEWLELYHTTLVDDLVKYGYKKDTFTLQNLLDEINHLWPFAVESGVFHAERLQLNSKENQEQYVKTVTEKDPVVKKQLMDQWKEDRMSHALFVQRILELATEAEERGVF